MKKVFSYIFSVFYYLLFGLWLVIFHVIQWVCFNVFGYQAHKKSVDVFNWFLLRTLHVLGSRITFENQYADAFQEGKPHIIVSNHQSMYDIPPIIWFLRKLHPKFVSKKELGKGIPAISYNLRHGGSILIDRKDSRQALTEIKKFSEYLNQTKRSAVIFPEGTRSKTGAPKKFSTNGLMMLFKYCPDAIVVPVTINNSWKLQRFGMFPLDLGVHLKMEVQEPIAVKDFDPKELVEKVEKSVTNGVII
ncbi:lysophospholipid acyltransferase family protein [Psychroflexus planctonicus]|uniref:1-acyl-sn-glycerol-3-phosphate acyltransferase n=1 Tax=Psychroflexus planctonicus TaxID=1526575 RepID=A0ABQ1SEQ5_9FLAO|nr:lysophospholipid acyltransferase family protein [Psychroflexus planctonicus]GGE34601.1 1-acyl-sn-glycerol-3-phosphate acyltransferase [Psychroflexus planctonicus]